MNTTSLSEHYPVLAAQLGRWPGNIEPDIDDETEEFNERADDAYDAARDDEERDKDDAMREDEADHRRELARFDAEGRGR